MTKAEKELNKKREIAAKLSNPKPIERPGGSWRCQIMVNGKRIGVTDPDPAVAHAKALAMKAGIIEEEQNASLITVGKAIDRYIESKNALYIFIVNIYYLLTVILTISPLISSSLLKPSPFPSAITL